MKKTLRAVLAAAIVFALAIAFVSCTEGEKTVEFKSGKVSGSNVYTDDDVGFKFAIPDDWNEKEAMEGVVSIVPDSYPEDSNNIAITKAAKDELFDTYTQETFEQLYSDLFNGFNFVKFEKSKIDGVPAIKMITTIDMQGISMKQYTYSLDMPDSTISITFTEVSDSDLSAVAEDCMNSFEVLK